MNGSPGHTGEAALHQPRQKLLPKQVQTAAGIRKYQDPVHAVLPTDAIFTDPERSLENRRYSP